MLDARAQTKKISRKFCAHVRTANPKHKKMENLEDIAREYARLKQEQKEFKKENKEVFVRNKEYNKVLAATRDALLEKMREESLEEYEVDGVEIIRKRKVREKHDKEHLAEALGSEEKMNEYLASITVEVEDLSSRKKKRTA